jgi:hypothetical protein
MEQNEKGSTPKPPIQNKNVFQDDGLDMVERWVYETIPMEED